MSSSYPTSIDSFTTKVDGVDNVMAAHINNLQDSVVAIETAIGAPPVFLTDVYSPIINGGMDIWQRGTSFAAIADGTYGPDRWLYQKSGAMVHTLSQETSVLPQIVANGATRKFNYALSLALTTPDTSIAAGDYCVLTHKVEGYNWNKLAWQPITVGFWVWSDIAGTYCVALRNSGADRSCVAEYTIEALEVGTWQFKSVTFPASPTDGTWNYTNGVGVQLHFTLAAGSTYQTTADAWQTGSFFATSNQVNGVNTGITPFRLTGVDMVLGAAPRSIVPFDYGIELARCQRYAYVLDYSTNTAGPTDGMKVSSTDIRVNVQHPVPMRSTPSLSHNISGYTAGLPGTTTIGLLRNFSGVAFNITGALTVSSTGLNQTYALLNFAAGTSWDGAVGESAQLRLGPDVRAILSAEL
jgi:hypothetical protein